MFDVSFSELVLILIVGLIVFGPEKLPEVVRTTGLWLGKLRRSFNNIRSEIEREVGVEELKRDLHNQAIMDSLKDVQNDLRGAQQHIEQLPHDVSKHLIGQAPAAAEPVPPAAHAAPASIHSVSTQSVSTQSVSTQSVSTQPASTPSASTQSPSTQPTSTQSASIQPAPQQHQSS